jgi:hypothetical protein
MSWDKYYTQHLWLWLPFKEATGTLTHDRSIWRITPFTLHGVPVWTQLASGIYVLDFNSVTPDWLDCPAVTSAKLDFTAGDFSMGVWAKIDDAVTRYLLCRGVANTDGWALHVSNALRVGLSTHQAGATQATYSAACITVGTWAFIGVSRTGATVRTFVNGQDRTDVPDVHVNPLTANRELHIGILNDEVTSPWDGQIWNPRIWGRYLQPWEWLELWNMERHWFSV